MCYSSINILNETEKIEKENTLINTGIAIYLFF